MSWCARIRARALTPERPVIAARPTIPDTFFQARKTSNPYYAAIPDIVQRAMDRVGALTAGASALPLQRPSRGGPRRDRHRLGVRGARRDRRVAERARRESGRAARDALPPVARRAFRAALPPTYAHCGARSDEGSRRAWRAAVSRRRRRRSPRPSPPAIASMPVSSADATACRRRTSIRRWPRRSSTS